MGYFAHKKREKCGYPVHPLRGPSRLRGTHATDLSLTLLYRNLIFESERFGIRIR